MRHAQAPAETMQSRGASALALDGRRLLIYASVGLAQADAFVHILVLREHFEEWWGYGAFFAALALAQIAYSLALVRWPRREVILGGIVGSAALLGIYIVSRTTGIPLIGPHAGHPEAVATVDLLSKALEAALLVTLTLLTTARSGRAGEPSTAGAPRVAADDASGLVRGRPAIKVVAGAVAILGLLFVGYRFGTGLDLGSRGGTVSATDAASCERRQCDIHFTATLAAPAYARKLGIWDDVEPRLGMSQAFVLTATAHAGAVRGLSMDDRVFLRQDGVLYPAAGRPVAITTHHNTYLVFFPRFDMSGRPLLERNEGHFDLVIKDPEGATEPRLLTFNYPLVDTTHTRLPWPQVMATLGAAMAALLFACTPCLVGSLTVGSMTAGAAAGFDRKAMRDQIRRRIVRQTALYLGAVVVAYLAVAAAVTVLGLEAEDLRPIEFVGGLVLAVIGLSLLRGSRPVATTLNRLTGILRTVTPWRHNRARDEVEVRFGEGSSSAMGASLAMVCSVAGAPTLSTAILLPLLVYAGLSHPIWALLVLAVYLLVSTVPFFLVAVGWGEFLMGVSLRWRAALVAVSGVMLVALGTLLVLSPAVVANSISAPARVVLGPLRWLS